MIVIYGLIINDLNPSDIITPKETFGAGIPNPTNESVVSIKIALGIENIDIIISCPKIFGKISLKIMCMSEAPNVFEAEQTPVLLISTSVL